MSPATLIKASRVDLADSALHAPQACFGDTDFYPTFTNDEAVGFDLAPDYEAASIVGQHTAANSGP